MNTRHALPLVVLAIASFGGYVTTASRPDVSAAPMAPIASHRHVSPAVVAHHGNHSEIAIHDMTLHAARHFDSSNAQPDSFREWPDWTPDWELRWLAFDCNGHSESVYHATNKHDPDVRFTITSDMEPSHDWTRAR